MHSRLRRALAVLLLAPFIGAPAERLPTPDALRAAGWHKGGWSGIEPATFEALPEGGLRLSAQGQASFAWRTIDDPGTCLSWRWRVDAGPPPTPLDRRGGDDRAIAITIGFDGWPAESGFLQRAKHALAQVAAGDHRRRGRLRRRRDAARPALRMGPVRAGDGAAGARPDRGRRRRAPGRAPVGSYGDRFARTP